MGMFDYVICDDLPLPEMNGKFFQTKDFDNTMETYKIIKGKLYRMDCKYEWVDDATLPMTKGYLKTVSETPIQVEYHGDIVFYRNHNEEDIFYVFKARFTDGKLEWIKDVREG